MSDEYYKQKHELKKSLVLALTPTRIVLAVLAWLFLQGVQTFNAWGYGGFNPEPAGWQQTVSSVLNALLWGVCVTGFFGSLWFLWRDVKSRSSQELGEE